MTLLAEIAMNLESRTLAAATDPCPLREILRTGLGASVSVALAGTVPALWHGHAQDATWLIGSIGASSVLMHAFPQSASARPYAVVVGNLVSAMAALALTHVPLPVALVAALAVGSAVVAMSLLRAFHPPGAGLALMTALGGVRPLADSLAFVLVSVLATSVVLVVATRMLPSGTALKRWGASAWAFMTAGHDCRDPGDSVP
jgi:CBS domain-containing membrane protein